MDSLLSWLALAAIMAVPAVVICGRRFVTGLTLRSSWGWAIAASLSVAVSTVVSGGFVQVLPGWISAAQYFAATMLLAPLVATLGARRPGEAAWQWFVVLPMIVVLQWPAVGQLMSSGGHEAIQLGAPATIGVLLVVVMSAGALLGTSMTLPALIYVASVLCCLLPSSGWVDSASQIPLLSPLLLVAALVRGTSVLQAKFAVAGNAGSLAESIDAAWQLFQTLYGLVWTRRVLDRVNQFSPREQWTVTLTLDGFRRSDGASVTEEELARPLEIFLWVLGRFADRTWFESLRSSGSHSQPGSSELKSG